MMHFLTANEILKFARCSKELKAMADDDFAWRHAVLVCSTKQLTHPPFTAATTLAARCASVALVLNGPLPKSWHFNPPAEAQATVRLLTTQVRTIYAAYSTEVPFGDWSSLFALGGFGPQIRCMDLTSERPLVPTAQVLRFIVQLPRLETLRLANYAEQFIGTETDPQHWSALIKAPALTELFVRDTHRSMEPIAHCLKLCTLSMQLPKDSPQLVMERFASASVSCGQRLESLSIDFGFNTQPFGVPVVLARAGEFVRACFAMPALVTLTLSNHALAEKQVQSLGDSLPPHIRHEGSRTTIQFRKLMHL